MKKTKIIGLSMMIVGFVLLGVVTSIQVHANGDHKSCWKKDCFAPTFIPTLTIDPCQGNINVHADFVVDCITPTPTPTVTPIPTEEVMPTPQPCMQNCGNPPTFAGSTTNAPASMTCTISFSAPVLVSITAGGSGTLNLNWLESDTGIDKFSVTYGLVGQPLTMGEDNIPGSSRSLAINMLPIGANINAEVWAWKNGCAEESNLLDPKVR